MRNRHFCINIGLTLRHGLLFLDAWDMVSMKYSKHISFPMVTFSISSYFFVNKATCRLYSWHLYDMAPLVVQITLEQYVLVVAFQFASSLLSFLTLAVALPNELEH